MRKEITVPAAGVSQPFSFTGRSVLIEQAAGYSSFEDVPVISFDVPGGQYPALARSKYQNPQGKFNKIVVTGTAGAAGDSLVLVSVDACVDDFINFDSLATGRAVFKDTFSKNSDDTVRTFTQVELLNGAGNLPSAMYITANGDSVHFAKGSDPTQNPDGIGHILSTGETMKIEGLEWIEDFRYVSATGGGASVISVTLEY